MPSGRKKCICQLCTCGRHMCPHRKKEQLVLGPDQQSAKALSHEDKRKQRKQWTVPNDKQVISLTTDQLNAQHVLADSTNLASALTVEDKGNRKESGLINEGKNWSAKQIPKTLPIRRPDNLKSEGSSDFRTTHQQDYKKKSSDDSHAGDTVDASSAMVQAESWNKRQIPRTQKIRKPDTLAFSGPLNLETTHLTEYSENKLKEKSNRGISEQHETYQRPRTSIKLGGEFQSDSSYQQEFTHKRSDEVVKIKKGISKGHLRPEGEMTFDTTSLDYNAASRATENSDGTTVLKPKNARPESKIKIATGSMSDETTLVRDFKRWNVEKPLRHKPSDTLMLGDAEQTDLTSVHRKGKSYSRSDASNTETSMSDYKNWQVKKPVIQKAPENNLKSEGNFHFDTTNDVDYSSRRDVSISKRTSILEPLTERTETESLGQGENSSREVAIEQIVDHGTIDVVHKAEITEQQKQSKDTAQKVDIVPKEDVIPEEGTQNTSHEIEQKGYEDNEIVSQGDEQEKYVTWEQIRPKPIRPHSNLRQEGGMEFSTTNRSEFVSRSTERVKGIRPKTTTKLFDGDFDATTMNQVMFSSDQAEKVSPIRPKGNLHVENGEFVDETTSSREFQPWKTKRPAPIVPRSNLAQEGTMDFTTTNNTEFEEKRPEKVFPIRPNTTNRISGDLELETTNRAMHAEFPIERVKKIVPQSNLRMSSGSFDSETTNKTQFQDWGIDRPKPIRPVPNLTQEGSMDFTTMNQLQFDEKPMEKLTQFRPHTSSKITGEFDGVTTNQIMYAAQPLDRPNMVKPRGNLNVEKGKFATATTNHDEFQEWQQSKPDAATPRNNLYQEGSLDYTTSNQVDFGAKPIDRVSEIRPKSNPKTTGDFDGTTTNQVMFQNTPREKLQAIIPQDNIQLEKGNFMSETTNNKEYQQWEYSKPSLIKPHSSMRQEGNMDFTTTNDREFAEKTSEKVLQIRPTTSTKITGEFEGTTTNQAMFQNNAAEKVKGKRPLTNIHLEKGKFENQTTASREFQQWDITRSEPIKPSGNLIQEGEMDFRTSNQRDFNQKAITMVEPIRPHTSSPITGDFDGTTMNQVMFQGQHFEKVHDIRPRDTLRVDSGQFNGESITTKEYGYKTGNKLEAIRPRPSLAHEGEFDFRTSNQMQFEGKQGNKVIQTRPKTITKASDGKFYSTTTNQAMYQTPAMESVHEIRPSDNLHVEGGKFQNITTSSDEYQQWKVQKPTAFQLASSLRQEGDMQFETTNNAEFKERSFDRVQQIRPKTTNKTEGEFEDTTTNQVMFQQHSNLERVKPIRQQNNLQLETGKFSNETTNSREFRQWVKMENKDSKSKRKPQAAGIRSEKEKSHRKKDSEVQKTNVESEQTQYEPWKLNKESVEMAAQSGKEKQSSNDETQNLLIDNSKSQNQLENVNTSRDDADQTFKSTSGDKQLGQVSNESEIQIQSVQKTTQDKQHTSRDISTMMADYGGKQTAKVKAIIPHGNLSNDGDMNFSTTSQTDYPRQTELMNKQETNVKASEKGGITETNIVKEVCDENGWKISEAQGRGESKEQSGLVRIKGSEAMESTTSQNVAVTRSKRFKPDDNLKIESVPFDGASTTRTEYTRLEGRRSSSKKRTESLKQEGNMEFDTTSNDYAKTKEYQMGREATKAKSKANQKGSLGQSGTMDFHTTSNSSYTGNFGSKSKNLRPRSSLKLGTDEPTNYESMSSTRSNPETSTRDYQDLTSTSRASYVGHTTSRRTRTNRPTTSQKVGQGSFEGQTISRTSFIAPQDQGEKHRAKKPENHNILNTINGFTGESTYKNSFDATKGHHCPVIDLQTGRSTLTFNEEKNGHMFYAPPIKG